MFSNFFKFPIGHLTHPPTSKVFLEFLFIYMTPKKYFGVTSSSLQGANGLRCEVGTGYGVHCHQSIADSVMDIDSHLLSRKQTPAVSEKVNILRAI